MLPSQEVGSLLGSALTEWFRFWLVASWTVIAWHARRRTCFAPRVSVSRVAPEVCRGESSFPRATAVADLTGIVQDSCQSSRRTVAAPGGYHDEMPCHFAVGLVVYFQ